MSYYMVNSFRSLDLPDLSWRTDRKGAIRGHHNFRWDQDV